MIHPSNSYYMTYIQKLCHSSDFFHLKYIYRHATETMEILLLQPKKKKKILHEMTFFFGFCVGVTHLLSVFVLSHCGNDRPDEMLSGSADMIFSYFFFFQNFFKFITRALRRLSGRK